MAIEKRFIHFKKFSDFNSKKLSANEANTQYTVGISGAIQNGSPDVLYQSYVWIKDTQQQWTHGQIYNGGDVDIDTSQYISWDDVDAEISDTSTNPIQNQAVNTALEEMASAFGQFLSGKQDTISDLATIRSNASKGATAVQPDAISEFITIEDVAKVATSGDYNDLTNKPTIPSAVTESTVSGWGFTKNTGTYSKPSGGIPQSDLAEEVKGALRKAEQYTGTVTEIKVNGTNIGASGGVVDLGNLGTYSKPTTGIPKSDLNSSVQASLGKADTAVQPADIKDDVYIADFTMESLRNGMNNGCQVNCDMQALITAMNANKVILVREGEDSAYKGVHVLNGYAEDLLYFSIVNTSGSILWCDGTALTDAYIDGRTLYLRSLDDKQDALKSGENIKTINGESIVGSGDITIESGSGTITGVSANGTSIATSGVANIPAASTSKYGVTKLTTLTNSSSTTLAATASAVKSAYDLANGRQEKLVSGTNIKTINNTSILGSGNIAIDANIQAVDTQETLDDVNTNTYVKYVAQTLTEEQKAQVRENIGIIDNNTNYVAWNSAIFEMGHAYYMTPNKKYICTLPLTHLIFIEGTMDDTWHNNVTDLYNEYTVIFECNETQIEIPNSWIWANGSVPTLENGVRYELSISLMYINNQYFTHAVLVPFKSV